MSPDAQKMPAEEDSRLAQARELVRLLERGEDAQVERLIDDMTDHRDINLFQQLGVLTRELHETINSFQIDSRLAAIADKDIPDAKERLNYVVTMTEEAAHKTLNAVEGSLPIAESLGASADELKAAWARFRGREMSLEEFRSLSKEIETFLDRTSADAHSIRSDLSAVMMAQSAQDLTGQIIRRVVSLVQDLEDNLVELVRLTGMRFAQDEETKDKGTGEPRGGGPVVPSVDKDVVTSQDEVDDLLSSLGF
ncbi:MAG: protein phosphatase CheZ [Thiohalocapsa sp.]